MSNAPALNAIAISKSDSTTFPPTRGIYIGGSGDLAVQMFDSSIVTFVALAAGIIHPISVTKVLSTGTSATNIVGVS